MKKLSFVLALVLVFSMVLSACTPAATPTAAPVEPTAEPVAVEPTAAPALKVCQVTDTGGIDDKSFNATAWKGAEDAVADLGVEAKYLESQAITDFEPNLLAFVDDKCDLIVTVGFLLGDATKASAEANPDIKYTIIDYSYDPAIPNVVGQLFQTDEAAFMAGYMAAGMTKTGKVGTFGGIPIPPVTIFMDGFTRGVYYYNQVKGTAVQVLGYDLADPAKGLYTNDFEDQTKGNQFAVSLMDEGADIILPVAGPVGLGAAAAVKERGNAWIIGVDSDWTLTAADYVDVILTSILKNMDVTTFNVIKAAMDGTYAGGTNVVGTLANGGVGLGTSAAGVPAELVAEVDQIKQDIIDGKIKLADVMAVKGPAIKVCQVTDTGGIDDKSFNATAWKGAEDAVAQLGVEAKYLESQAITDFEPNLLAFVDDKCELIVTVGFLLGDATKASAEANPDINYTIIDYSYDPAIPNVVGQLFQTDEAAFMAGYMAAGMTKTGKVGTFGGIPIPPVTIFMDGFARGVKYYNQVKGTAVEVLGYPDLADPSKGLFTNDFEDQTKGNQFAVSLMDEGADIILPVAGPVGLGAAAAVKERGNAWIIGVDSDWTLTAADYVDVILTSILKNMDVTTFNVIKDAQSGAFPGGTNVVGTLANGGVGLGTSAAGVPAELLAEIEQIKQDIIDGKIKLADIQ